MIELVLVGGSRQAERLERSLHVRRDQIFTVSRVLRGALRGAVADRVFYSAHALRTRGSILALEEAHRVVAGRPGGEVLHADHWDMLHETTQQELPPHERMLALTLRAGHGGLRNKDDVREICRRARQAIVEHGYQRGIRVYAPHVQLEWHSRRNPREPWLAAPGGWRPSHGRLEWRLTAYWSAPLEVG